MSKKKTIITLQNLPLRPRKITAQEVIKIFGGACGQQNADCNCTPCCENYKCVTWQQSFFTKFSSCLYSGPTPPSDRFDPY